VKELPEPVERVARFLRESAVESRIEEFAAGTPTADDAARAVGCDLAQIVKSLLFVCDDRPVLVLVPGDRRADRVKISHETGATRTKVATAEEVARITGFEAGGVAPFPLPAVQTVLADPRLLAHTVIWVGAGSSRHMAVLAPPDLMRLARARSVDVVAENA
jgi:prolyl-tRNA editing enzyme YbaK/EbsC (Cys-tRNA(Pro) deacylase)